MHFEITASLQSLHKQLTPAQRNSSLFSEAPRLAGKTLRRGQVMRLSEAEFKTNEVMAKRLFDAGAIDIVMVDGDHREDLRTKKSVKGKIPEERRGEIPPEALKVGADSIREAEDARILEELRKESPPPSAPKVEVKAEVPPPSPEPSPEPAKELEPAEEEKVVLDAPKEPEAAPEPVPAPPPSAPAPVVTESKGKKGKR